MSDDNMKRWLRGWLDRPCPNCGRWITDVPGNWFIRRRRATRNRDHWKVCEA